MYASAAARDAKLEALHAQLTTAVEALCRRRSNSGRFRRLAFQRSSQRGTFR